MRLCLVLSASLLVSACSAPQGNQSVNKEFSNPAIGRQTVFVPLDQSGKDLKVKTFRSGKDLLDEVEKLGGPRGEYEADSAFFGRLSKLGDYSIAGVVTPSSIKFDAATGKLSIKASMHDAKGFGFVSKLDSLEDYRKIFPSVYIGEDEYHNGQYSGQNSYGATTVVTKRTIDRYYLVFSPVAQPVMSTLFFDVSSELDVDAAEIQAQRDNVRLMFTVKSVPNYLQVVKSYQEATVRNPYESIINNYFFSSKIFWVKVVNIKTGKVYSDEAKISISAL